MSKIRVKIWIDNVQNRVLFAEASSDFVDVLFSLLALPLGRIVQLLGKKTCLGSLDNLYKTVEKLDTKYLQTKACKEILLNPQSANAELWARLKIEKIHNQNPNCVYLCSGRICSMNRTQFYSHTKKCMCHICDKEMDRCLKLEDPETNGEIFLNKATNFIITPDLRVMPNTLRVAYSILSELQVKDASILEERIVDFGTKEVLNLLQKSFLYKNAFTDVCFPNSYMHASLNQPLLNKDEMVNNKAGLQITLKLAFNKKNNKLLYADAGDDFVNHLFSLLTLPLGHVLKFLHGDTLGGCIINLYKSVQNINLNVFKSNICRDILLTPKLFAHHGFQSKVLEIEEDHTNINGCIMSSLKKELIGQRKEYCVYIPFIEDEITERNPKLANGVIHGGEAFVVGPRRFKVEDDLSVSPLSCTSIINSGTDIPLSDLIIKEVWMDKEKVRMLLGSMLISKTVLTDIFIRN